jgi:multidrug efflux pump subunit AcrA (membrane-fusion protein)
VRAPPIVVGVDVLATAIFEHITTVVRMSRLDEAQQRLNAALTRLERAVEAKVKAAGESGACTVDDGQLEALKAENEQLRQASAEAGERLDTAIRRLEGVLDG